MLPRTPRSDPWALRGVLSARGDEISPPPPPAGAKIPPYAGITGRQGMQP